MFDTDIPGDLKLRNGLRHVKGIGFSAGNAILEKANIDPDKYVGDITEEEKEMLENLVEEGELPGYLLNRKKDPDTGEHEMLVSTQLEMQERQDIEAMKKIGSYKGLRHRRGLPVRGQKTKSSFRGKSTVGVSTADIKAEKSGE